MLQILPGNLFCRQNGNITITPRRAEVAQLVEQLIRNEQVVGSSPIFGSILLTRLRMASHARD